MASQSRFRTRQDSYVGPDEDLRRLEEENQIMRDQLQRYQLQIQSANDQLIMLKQRYQMLINEISMREKAAEEISRIALKEANQIIETAQGNADIIIKEALGSARMVFREIERLTSQTKVMRYDIKLKMDSMGELLNSFQIPEVMNLDYLAKIASEARKEETRTNRL